MFINYARVLTDAIFRSLSNLQNPDAYPTYYSCSLCVVRIPHPVKEAKSRTAER